MEQNIQPVSMQSQETTESQESSFQPDIKQSFEKPYKEKSKSKLVPILLGIVIVILGGIYGMLISQVKPKNQTMTESKPTPSASPSLQTTQPLSSLATSSAFLTAEQTIASLSAAITSLNVSDTTLNPPAIDLSLGLEVK